MIKVTGVCEENETAIGYPGLNLERAKTIGVGRNCISCTDLRQRTEDLQEITYFNGSPCRRRCQLGAAEQQLETWGSPALATAE